MEINQNNVELHIERYYHLSYFSDKKEIFLFTKQFIHNYNYFNISEKGYLRSLKDNLFFDYLDEFFGNFFQRYCVYKYIDTIKNLFSLYMKKNKIILNTLFFTIEDFENFLITNEQSHCQKEIIQNFENIIKEIYLKIEKKEENINIEEYINNYSNETSNKDNIEKNNFNNKNKNKK